MSILRSSAALLAGILCVSVVGSVFAKTPEDVRAQCRAEGRPCVGLVLSGGGARGFAHAGVLRVLEELGVKVDVVTGTSMGSMVGGAYAAGYTAAQIEDIITGVDWDKMMAPRAERAELPWRLKKDDYLNLPNNAITLTKDGRVELPESVIPSQELEIFLNDKTGPVNYVNDLSELALPYAAIATDLVTGDRVVLQKGVNLGRAMRASMSIPGAFAPVSLEGRLLVDGGLVDNLPIALARDMGADVIIAVNVGTPLLKRSELGNVVTVMAQMVNLLTEQNVQTSLAQIRNGDILITPDLDGYSSADLKKSREIIEVGYRAANELREALGRYAVAQPLWAVWEHDRQRAVLPATRRTEHRLAAVKVEGVQTVSAEALITEADIDISRPVSNEEIDEASRRLWADGDFTSVRYRFEPGPDGTEVLVFEPKEKRPGYSSVRIGGSLETDFDESQTFNVLFSHKWGWLNSWGGELRTDLLIGERKSAGIEFFQPLGAGSNWFFNPTVTYEWQPFDLYYRGENIAEYRNELLTAELGLGYTIGRLGYLRSAAGWIGNRVSREVGTINFPTPSIETSYFSLELNLDTLDNVNFPTSGYRMTASAQQLFNESNETGRSSIYHLTGTLPITVGRWTTLLHGEIGRSAVPSVFSLGGAFELTGSPYGRWTGSDLQLGTVRISRNVSDIFGSAQQPIWAGISLEAGRAWNRGYDGEWGDDSWRYAYGGYLGIDSLIGPLYLMTGRTKNDDWSLYFFWGHKL